MSGPYWSRPPTDDRNNSGRPEYDPYEFVPKMIPRMKPGEGSRMPVPLPERFKAGVPHEASSHIEPDTHPRGHLQVTVNNERYQTGPVGADKQRLAMAIANTLRSLKDGGSRQSMTTSQQSYGSSSSNQQPVSPSSDPRLRNDLSHFNVNAMKRGHESLQSDGVVSFSSSKQGGPLHQPNTVTFPAYAPRSSSDQVISQPTQQRVYGHAPGSLKQRLPLSHHTELHSMSPASNTMQQDLLSHPDSRSMTLSQQHLGSYHGKTSDQSKYTNVSLHTTEQRIGFNHLENLEAVLSHPGRRQESLHDRERETSERCIPKQLDSASFLQLQEIARRTGSMLSKLDGWQRVSLKPKDEFEGQSETRASAYPDFVNISDSAYTRLNASSSVAQTILKNISLIGAAFGGSSVSKVSSSNEPAVHRSSSALPEVKSDDSGKSVSILSGLHSNTLPSQGHMYCTVENTTNSGIRGQSDGGNELLGSYQTNEKSALKHGGGHLQSQLSLSASLDGGRTSDSPSCDSVIAQMLKSVGFNFELSKQNQLRAQKHDAEKAAVVASKTDRQGLGCQVETLSMKPITLKYSAVETPKGKLLPVQSSESSSKFQAARKKSPSPMEVLSVYAGGVMNAHSLLETNSVGSRFDFNSDESILRSMRNMASQSQVLPVRQLAYERAERTSIDAEVTGRVSDLPVQHKSETLYGNLSSQPVSSCLVSKKEHKPVKLKYVDTKQKTQSSSKQAIQKSSRSRTRSRSPGSKRHKKLPVVHHRDRRPRSRSPRPSSRSAKHHESSNRGKHSNHKQQSKSHKPVSRRRSPSVRSRDSPPLRKKRHSRSRSPQKRSRSPQKRSRSPLKRSHSPQKRSRSPQKLSQPQEREEHERLVDPVPPLPQTSTVLSSYSCPPPLPGYYPGPTLYPAPWLPPPAVAFMHVGQPFPVPPSIYPTAVLSAPPTRPYGRERFTAASRSSAASHNDWERSTEEFLKRLEEPPNASSSLPLASAGNTICDSEKIVGRGRRRRREKAVTCSTRDETQEYGSTLSLSSISSGSSHSVLRREKSPLNNIPEKALSLSSISSGSSHHLSYITLSSTELDAGSEDETGESNDKILLRPTQSLTNIHNVAMGASVEMNKDRRARSLPRTLSGTCTLPQVTKFLSSWRKKKTKQNQQQEHVECSSAASKEVCSQKSLVVESENTMVQDVERSECEKISCDVTIRKSMENCGVDLRNSEETVSTVDSKVCDASAGIMPKTRPERREAAVCEENKVASSSGIGVNDSKHVDQVMDSKSSRNGHKGTKTVGSPHSRSKADEACKSSDRKHGKYEVDVIRDRADANKRRSASRSKTDSRDRTSRSKDSRDASRSSRSKVEVKEASSSYRDSGHNDCDICVVQFASIRTLLDHLQSYSHRLAARNKDLSKRRREPPENSGQRNSSKAALAKGAEFMASVTMPFYCKLCHMFFNEPKDAELHILGVEHNENYQNFITKNPDYESGRKAKSRRGGENRDAKAEAQRSTDSDTKRKRKSVHSKSRDEKRLKVGEKKVDESAKTDVLPDASDSSSVYSVISSDESDAHLPLGVTLVTIDEAPVDGDDDGSVEANSAFNAANLDCDEGSEKQESDNLSSWQGGLLTEKIDLDCRSDFLVGWVVCDCNQDSVANGQVSKTDDSCSTCKDVLVSALSGTVSSDVSDSIVNANVGAQSEEAEMGQTEQRCVPLSDEASFEGMAMGVVVSIEENRRESDSAESVHFNASSDGVTAFAATRDQNLGSNVEVDNDAIHVLSDDDDDCLITDATVSEIENCDAKLLHVASDRTPQHSFIATSDVITSAAIPEVVSSSSVLELTSESDVGSLVSAKSSATSVAIEKSEAEVIETSEDIGDSNRRDVAHRPSENRIAHSSGIMTDSSSVTVVCEAGQGYDPANLSETRPEKVSRESPDDAFIGRNESNTRHVLGIAVGNENSQCASHDDVNIMPVVRPTMFDEILPQVNTSVSETLPLVLRSTDINRGSPEAVRHSDSFVEGEPLTLFSSPEIHVSAVASGTNATFSPNSAKETRPAELTRRHSSSGEQMSPVDSRQFVNTASCQDAVISLSTQETSGEGDRPSEVVDDERLLNDDDNLEVEML